MIRIALEGGGARSAFSAGVLEVLVDAGVPIERVVASSSGCINASFLTSGQIHHVCELWSDPGFTPQLIRWEQFFNPFGGPGIDVDALCFELLQPNREIDLDAFFVSELDCHFTLTDVGKQKVVTKRPGRDNFYQWLCASMAIPVAYNRVVEVEGDRYVDGGVLAPIPFDLPADASPSEHTIAIITRPIKTNKPRPPAWHRALIRWLVPNDIRSLVLHQHEHHNAYLEKIRTASNKGELTVLSPPESGIPASRLTRDTEKLEETVEIGREVARDWLKTTTVL